MILRKITPDGPDGVMKTTQFGERQLVKILREGEQGPVIDAAKRHGI